MLLAQDFECTAPSTAVITLDLARGKHRRGERHGPHATFQPHTLAGAGLEWRQSSPTMTGGCATLR